MKTLNIWGWLLFAASVFLWGYGWISGEFNGHGIAQMGNVALLLTIFSVVCLLLSITIWMVGQAIKEKLDH